MLQSSVGTGVGANTESATQPFYEELQIPEMDFSLGINLKSLVTEIWKMNVLGQLVRGGCTTTSSSTWVGIGDDF